MKQNRLFKYAMLLAWMICSFVGAGCSEDEGPGYRMPNLSVNETPSNLTHSSATLSGYVELFGTAVDQCGFIVHSTKGILEKEGIYESAAYTAVMSSNGTVTLNLTDLEAETTYYYCLFVKAGKTVLKSNISEFKTEPIGIPTFSDINVLLTEEYEIKLQCQVRDNGGQPMTGFGFEYKLSTAQTYSDRVTVNQYDEGSTDSTFTAVISVEPGTAYWIRAYGSNGDKEGFSKDTYIETPAKTSPTVSLLEIGEDNKGVNYCTVSGKIENTGESEVTERGFIYSRSSNFVISGKDVTQVPVDAQTSLFSAELQGLQESTTYYVRAYAANKPYGTTQYGYSKVQEFTTKSFRAPEVYDVEVEQEGNTLKLSCSVMDNGIQFIEQGFCWSTTDKLPTINNSTKAEGQLSEDKTTLSGVLPNVKETETTPYYIRAFVRYYRSETNEEETYSGNVTEAWVTLPTPEISSVNITDISKNSANVSVAWKPNDVPIVEKGILWGTNDNPTTVMKVTGTDFSSSLKELSANKRYYVKAYVKYKWGDTESTIYSELNNFTTASLEEANLATPIVSEIGYTNATVQSSVELGEGAILQKQGFFWNESESFTLDNCLGSKELKPEDNLLLTLDDLDVETHYYIRAYAVITGYGQTITSYSPVGEFQTMAKPMPALNDVEVELNGNTLNLTTTVEKAGIQFKDQGFCWSTSNVKPTLSDQFVKATMSGNNLSASITVEENKTYYICACVSYNVIGVDETQYGPIFEYEVGSLPTPEIKNILCDVKVTSATVTAVWNSNNVEIIEKGFLWGTTATTQLIVEGTEFKAELTGLDANKKYYVKAYVKYKWGNTEKSVSSDLYNFTTASIKGATVETPEVSAISFTEATVKASIADMGEGTLVKKGFYWGTDDWGLSLENCIGQKELTAEEDFQYTMTGLSDNTWYYVKAYAVTEGNGQTLVSSSSYAEFHTNGIGYPRFNELSVSEITDASFKVTASVYWSDWGNVDITEVGFCWSLKDEEPADMQQRKAVEKDGDSFTLTVNENLTKGAVYYVYGYAINSFGTVTYTPKSEVELKRMPADNENPYPGKE